MTHRAVFRRLCHAVIAVVVTIALIGAGVAVAARQDADQPLGVYLTPEELQAMAAQFTDEVLTGGQVAPRISRWVNENVFIFLQLDNPDPAQATAIRYVGIGVKGVFCAETQPDRSFTHFHKYDAPEYAAGHGSQPGDQGYWLTWVATETFDTRDGRHVTPGVDYEFSPTPPPACGANIPEVAFDPPGADNLTAAEIGELMALFNDGILTGGQTPPRSHKWVNKDVTVFLQFDSPDPAAATALRDIGITVPGTFCTSSQPSEDYPHFHQTHAPAYGEGHGSAPEQVGYWLLWVATDTYETRDGRQVTPGVDRQFSPTPPPDCGAAPATPASAGAGASLAVTGNEYRFEPPELRARAGEMVSMTFTNTGAIPHTLTVPAAQADTGSVAAGASATISFAAPVEAGRYEFLCSFGGHAEAGMVGALIVE
jgi:plastocyanin